MPIITKKIFLKVRRILAPFLLHPHIRYWTGRLRFIYYARVLKRVRLLESGQAVKNTISHNLDAFKNLKIDFFMKRMPRLIHAVLASEAVHEKSRVLVVGPRTESDLLILMGHRYFDVVGLDLISYSPWVQLGDMHQIPFSNDSFDAVICGWCLSYSNTPQLAVQELIRVCKPQGVVAIGVDYWKYNSAETKAILGDFKAEQLQDQGRRINSTKEIRELFGKSLGHVYFDHDAPLKNLKPHEIEARSGLMASLVMFVASVTKN